MFSLNYILNINNNLNIGREDSSVDESVNCWLKNRFSHIRQRAVQTGFMNRFKRFPEKIRLKPNDSFTNRTSLLPRRNWQQLGRLCEQTRRTDTAENKTLPLQWAPPSPFPHRLSVHINKPTRTSALTPFPRFYSGAVRTFLANWNVSSLAELAG